MDTAEGLGRAGCVIGSLASHLKDRTPPPHPAWLSPARGAPLAGGSCPELWGILSFGYKLSFARRQLTLLGDLRQVTWLLCASVSPPTFCLSRPARTPLGLPFWSLFQVGPQGWYPTHLLLVTLWTDIRTAPSAAGTRAWCISHSSKALWEGDWGTGHLGPEADPAGLSSTVTKPLQCFYKGKVVVFLKP